MDYFDFTTNSFNERLERTKELCKRQLRSQVEVTVDNMFDFFREEFESAVRRVAYSPPKLHGSRTSTVGTPNIEILQVAPSISPLLAHSGASNDGNSRESHSFEVNLEQQPPRPKVEAPALPPALEEEESILSSGSECSCGDCEGDKTKDGRATIKREIPDDDEEEVQEVEVNQAEKRQRKEGMAAPGNAGTSQEARHQVKEHHQQHRRRRLHRNCEILGPNQAQNQAQNQKQHQQSSPATSTSTSTKNSHPQASTSTSSSAASVRPFWCRFEGCHRSFRAHAHLKEHENIHRGVRPYRCKWPDCGYDAIQKNNVITHVRGVHFRLPLTLKEQIERNIRDNRDPAEWVEVKKNPLA